MAHGHLVLAVRNEVQIVNRLKISIQITFFDPVSVMVTDDQMLFSTQLSEILLRRLFVSEHQVAQDKYGIMGVNTLIPVADQNAVHFFNIDKWPVTQANDFFMPQM